MSVFGGGLEGARVLSDRVEDRIYRQGTATPGDVALLLAEAVRSELYILASLSERRIATPAGFFDGRGDPVIYASSLTATRLSLAGFTSGDAILFLPAIQSTARSIRNASLLNLLDYGLVSAGVTLSRDYLSNGQRRLPVGWLTIGSVSLVPGLRYTLSPIGPERQVRTRYRVGGAAGQIYVRWTEALVPGSGALRGAGAQYHHKTFQRVDPTLSVDVWRNPDRSVAARGELAATLTRSPADRLLFSIAIGAKGRGYLLGYPITSGAYATVGGGFRF